MINLRRQGALMQRLAPQFQAVSVPPTAAEATALIRSSFYDSLSTLEALLRETAREISTKVGLFCLSRRCDSLPMWAHDAANASGLTIEFRDLEKIFSGDETGILRQPIPLTDERERFGVTFEPKSHESLFFAKFQDWSYEQEVRVVLPLAECRPELFDGRPCDFDDLPRSCVARVILGCT